MTHQVADITGLSLGASRGQKLTKAILPSTNPLKLATDTITASDTPTYESKQAQAFGTSGRRCKYTDNRVKQRTDII